MSLWQFRAAVGGYAKANSAGDNTLNSEEAAALADWLDEPPVWH